MSVRGTTFSEAKIKFNEARFTFALNYSRLGVVLPDEEKNTLNFGKSLLRRKIDLLNFF